MNSNTTFAGAHVVFHRQLPLRGKGQVLAVLLSKRTQNAPTEPGQWGLVGGTADPGETAEETAKREVKEELKYCCDPLDLDRLQAVLTTLQDVVVPREDGDHLMKYFCAPLDYSLDKVTLRANADGFVEGDGIGWFTAEEVTGMVVRIGDCTAVNNFFAQDPC